MTVRLLACALSVCALSASAQNTPLKARKGFSTKLTRTVKENKPLQAPPPALFSLVKVKTPLGPMSAYLSKPRESGTKSPGIVWITGGFPPGGIGPSAWERSDPNNDQSAKVYREAGMVMLYPTLRGSFDNPGKQECFLGEVEDALAAIEHLRSVDYVDPERIYLGGHSTGGTLALLVAACTDKLAGVISFGPVASPKEYGADVLTYDWSSDEEHFPRSPINFLDAIKAPTYVIEGSERGNLESVFDMQRATKNPMLHFMGVNGASHFDVLAPVNALIAKKLMALEAGGELELSAREVQLAFTKHKAALHESADLRILARLRARGVELTSPQTTHHYLLSRSREDLVAASARGVKLGFKAAAIESREDRDGRPYHLLVLSKQVTLGQLSEVFAASRAAKQLCAKHNAQYDGWAVD